jgi:hypothetical protein
MPFSKSVLFSHLVSLFTRNISARWIRLVCIVSFFGIALSSLPVHLKHDSATAQGSRPQRTQGPPSRNLPNLDDVRRIEPGTPKIMSPVPATKCRGRDEKCKKAKGKISNNLSNDQDRLQAYAGHQSRRDYMDWFSAGNSPLSVLADLIYWPASMISNLPDLPYRDGGSVLAESAVKSANPLGETYGAAASVEPGRKYGPGGWTPGASLSGNDATIVSQSVPATMTAGEAYTVTVRMLNQGISTWTAANQYRLGSWNPVGNGTWGLGRVFLEAGESVPPGVLKTFSFQVMAPSTTGSYNFQWHMLREGVIWFGAASTNLVIAANATAVDQAQFVSQSVPSSMTPQNAYSVSVTMKNTGNTTWDSNYRLGSQNPHDNTIWGLGRVYLASGETIPPGGSKTFTFTVTAPASPSSYALFQWQMVHELVQWFGDYSSGVVVALSPNLNMALIDPINRIGLPGEDLLSRNYNWSLPLLALPGRAGLDLGLALSLNSLVYTRAGSVMYFDPLQGDLGPGFTLGFPEIRNAFTNTEANTPSYLVSMPSGRRVEFRQINTNVYEAVDSSYMLLTRDPVTLVFILYTTDGTQCKFVDVTGSGDYKCVQIKDRQGNYITIGYGSLAEIRTVTSTLGQVINFNYDSTNHLISITQNWGGRRTHGRPSPTGHRRSRPISLD